jgi:hypothetical protein
MALGGGPAHHPVKVLEVHWVPERREWEVQVRAVSDDGEPDAWASYDGAESELDQLLGIARDTITGG